jgi:6-phosphogluconolactonase
MVGCGMKTKTLKNAIVRDLQKALLKNNKATLFVSGGSTPKELFVMLSRTNLPWGKITISLCDERYVFSKHKDSNAKLVSNYLLKYYAKKAKFLPLYEDKRAINSLVKKKSLKVKSLGKLDVVILGMGNDGHTASLFPNNKKLKTAFNTKDSCINITPDTAPYERISLTKNALLNSSNLYLHTNGDEKKEVLKNAKANGNIYTYPILAFVNKKLKVYQL